MNEYDPNLTRMEARTLVDAYYTIQDYRKAMANQIRAATPAGEAPSAILMRYLGEYERLEGEIKRDLDRYTSTTPVGRWLKSITGIGPVISAGLLAHIDIERAPTVSHVWSFAGLNPSAEWQKGERRPWNAALKTLCWKAGESFVKFQNHENDHYGRYYVQRKALESERNEAGAYAEQAKRILETKRIGRDTEAYRHYAAGKLPPAHIHARATRWTVKLFLSHVWQVMYMAHYGAEPPAPYAIAHLDHADIIPLPVPFDPGEN